MWGKNDSFGSKINRMGKVESECGFATGETGRGWGAISIAPWWLTLEENFIPHLLVIPFEIWEILMGRNREEMHPRRKLGIGMTGNVGGGPPINALGETIEGFIAG